MKTEFLAAKGIPVSVSVIAFAAMLYSSHAWAQGTVESCDGGKTWSPSCGGGRGGGGSSSGPSFQNLFNNLFGVRRPSSTTRAPDPADIAFDQGKVAAKAGRWEEAEKAFRRALALEKRPTALVFVHAHLSVVYWQLGRLEDAIAAVRAGLTIDPNHKWSKEQLAALLTDRLAAKEKAGIIEGAEQDYREALALAPDNPIVQSWKGWIEEIREDQQAKQMRDRLLGSLDSKANTGTGLAVMDLSSASSSKAQPPSGGLQPFPSASVGVSPGTSASAAPAAGRSGGGTAVEQARGASESGQSARDAGLSGGGVPTREPGSDIARIVFDTPGRSPSGGGDAVVDVSNLGRKPRYEPPPEYAAKPDIARMEQERRRLETRAAEIETERADVEKQRNAEPDLEKRGKLDVKLTNLDLEKANIPSQLQVLVLNQQAAVERYKSYNISLGQAGAGPPAGQSDGPASGQATGATPTGNTPTATENRLP